MNAHDVGDEGTDDEANGDTERRTDESGGERREGRLSGWRRDAVKRGERVAER